MITEKTIMIIGGTGSLGYNLTQYYHQKNNITIFSRDENKQWSMKSKYPLVKYIIGDMRNINSVEKAIRSVRPNIIIIAGALKHVDICENNISECIDTNIIGVKNIVETVLKLDDQKIETVLLISTDKSCSPVNVYGMSKSISERIIAESSLKSSNTRFLSVRYGNVMNSRGSIIPRFREIGESKDQPSFPITNDKMTRFFMTLDQSVKLIDTAINHGEKGDTWIPKIDSFKIIDIAKYFSEKYNKPITISGIRPGEKIHECLVNQSELYRTVKKEINGVIYYVIKTCYTQDVYSDLSEEYTSENTSSIELFNQLCN